MKKQRQRCLSNKKGYDEMQQKSNEELAMQIQMGDSSVLEQLWEQCYGFIRLQASRFIHEWTGNRGFELDDLIQQGYFGLCDACKTFAPGKASFCFWLSLHLKTAFQEAAGCRTVAQRMEPLNCAGSLDEPVKNGSSGEDGKATKGDFIEDPTRVDFAIDDEIFQEQCAKILRCKVVQLQANQRTAVEMKYWENATDQAIADKLQCSRTYANTSVKDGLKAMRRHDTDNTLRNLLDDLYYEKRNLYNHIGWGFFKSTGYSSPEYEVCKKEERNQRKKSRKERENEIALVMKYFEVDRATAEELLSMKTA